MSNEELIKENRVFLEKQWIHMNNGATENFTTGLNYHRAIITTYISLFSVIYINLIFPEPTSIIFMISVFFVGLTATFNLISSSYFQGSVGHELFCLDIEKELGLEKIGWTHKVYEAYYKSLKRGILLEKFSSKFYGDRKIPSNGLNSSVLSTIYAAGIVSLLLVISTILIVDFSNIIYLVITSILILISSFLIYLCIVRILLKYLYLNGIYNIHNQTIDLILSGHYF